jgi:predicted ATPase
MSDFKLIAIRPLKDSYAPISKVLKEGYIYKFYNECSLDLKDSNDQLSEIVNCKYIPGISDDLYSLDKPKINISAVVGKNGSGKSSIMDLFYAFCFSIAVIDNKIEGINPNVSKKGIELIDSIKVYQKLNCELYYLIDTIFYRIVLNKGKYIHQRFSNKHWKKEPFDYSNFFYSLSINYSLYGLNSNDHLWLDFLFHKNDGYQLPVVINPYRKEGNIDVNSELHLAQTRTLLNLSTKIEDNPIVVNKKQIEGIEFTIDVVENDSIHITGLIYHSCANVFKLHNETHKENILYLFNKISKPLAGFELSAKEIKELLPLYDDDINADSTKKYLWDAVQTKSPVPPTKLKIKYEFIKYVIHKLFKICIYYPSDYGIFLRKSNKAYEKKPLILENIDKLIQKIRLDKSHLTLKLRQALYSIKEKYFELDKRWQLVNYRKNINQYSYQLYLKWSEVKSLIVNAEDKNKKRLDERMQIVMGAFVKPVIKIKNNTLNKGEYKFSSLSSGEQQLANTLQTITYHLYNINSVHKSRGKKARYKYVNIILDEVELYFHPEFSRIFISELINSIDQLKLNKITGINILFSTHSPFILSDIPNSNILRLKDGIPVEYNDKEQTFGANIHDLLANEFFMDDGFMGERAKEMINDLINFLDNIIYPKKKQEVIHFKWDEKRAQLFINLIGEPLIKDSLKDMYSQAFLINDKEKLQFEIDRLTELLKK